ncbi:MAG TPA: hypothetical protein VN727_07500 [Candidatus Binatia bacterium]|nr:hypothetical protein [Candidatus Binatia bacterium]
MKLKSYFSHSVETALGAARRELGSDAVLVHSRKTGPDTRFLGEYEVVCASVPEEETAARPGASRTHSTPRGSSTPDSIEKLSSEILDLRKGIERLSSWVNRTASKGVENACWPAAAAALIDAEVEPHLVQSLLSDDSSGNNPAAETARNDEQIRSVLERGISKRIKMDASLPGENRRAVALVGPPGVGKTTTLVKLAVHYGLQARRTCQILTADFHRVAASEILRSYSAILGIGFQAVETPAALGQALGEHHARGLVLIDTPGFSRHEMRDAEDLAQMLAGHADVQLVIAASTKAADVRRIVDDYEIFHPSRLLFTKLDETDTHGAILNEAIRTGKPLSYFSRGPLIPEDLEEASKNRVIELILGNPVPAVRAVSAAA